MPAGVMAWPDLRLQVMQGAELLIKLVEARVGTCVLDRKILKIERNPCAWQAAPAMAFAESLDKLLGRHAIFSVESIMAPGGVIFNAA